MRFWIVLYMISNTLQGVLLFPPSAEGSVPAATASAEPRPSALPVAQPTALFPQPPSMREEGWRECVDLEARREARKTPLLFQKLGTEMAKRHPATVNTLNQIAKFGTRFRAFSQNENCELHANQDLVIEYLDAQNRTIFIEWFSMDTETTGRIRGYIRDLAVQKDTFIAVHENPITISDGK